MYGSQYCGCRNISVITLVQILYGTEAWIVCRKIVLDLLMSEASPPMLSKVGLPSSTYELLYEQKAGPSRNGLS